MSTRRMLNLSQAAVGLLLLAAVGFIGSSYRQSGDAAVQLEVAASGPALIGALVANADSLATGLGRQQVLAARTALGQTIISFDQRLGALLGGGTVPFDDGRARRVKRVGQATARHALEQASQVWLETGVPLGDLAAGQYSPLSAAGQQAVTGLHANQGALAQHMSDVVTGLRLGAAERARLVGYAVWAAVALGAACLGLPTARLWSARRARIRATAPARAAAKARAVVIDDDDDPTPRGRSPFAKARPEHAAAKAPYLPTIDFQNVSAAVDQMSVDMNTIAGSSDKMRQAIDSVGFALQGMLYSLNEMAQDTAEGHRIVRNANNAAAFTADAATELVDSAREMARIVGRVTQLAQRTRQVAAQIEGEAVQTGRTGEAFTSVVAQEVKGLAQQTNRATFEIDQTVNEVLATARQYEEAIGLIIKNVAAINKVSENLGRLMLDPPRRVQPGTPVASAFTLDPAPAVPTVAASTPAPVPPAAAPTPTPAPAPLAKIEDDPVATEPTPRQVAQSTNEAITAAAAQGAPATGTAPTPVPAEPADTAQPVSGGSGSVFMLGKPRKKPSVAEVLGTEPAEPAAQAVPAPAPTPVPAIPVAAAPVAAPADPPPLVGHASPQADGGSNRNVFLLNKPKTPRPAETSAAPAVAAPLPAPEAAPAAAIAPAETAGTDAEPGGSNIFRLNRPKKKTATAEGAAATAPAGEGATATAVADAPVPEPAAPTDDGTPAPPKKNFIMLNQPK